MLACYDMISCGQGNRRPRPFFCQTNGILVPYLLLPFAISISLELVWFDELTGLRLPVKETQHFLKVDLLRSSAVIGEHSPFPRPLSLSLELRGAPEIITRANTVL